MLQGPTMPRKVKFKCQDGSHAPCCSSEVPEHSSASADAHLEASLPADTRGVFLLQRAANQLASPKVVGTKVQQLPAQICSLRFWSRDPSGNRDQKDRRETEIVSLLRHRTAAIQGKFWFVVARTPLCCWLDTSVLLEFIRMRNSILFISNNLTRPHTAAWQPKPTGDCWIPSSSLHPPLQVHFSHKRPTAPKPRLTSPCCPCMSLDCSGAGEQPFGNPHLPR